MEQARANNIRVNSGLMSYEDFITWAAEAANVPRASAKPLIESNVPNEPLLEYIRDYISPRYQVGMLSNAAGNWLSDLFEPWQAALFDEVVLSHELGVVKPHPLTYETIAEQLGVLPEEAVFIDDRKEFIAGALAVGMSGIHYRDFEQTKAELEALLHA